jgi:hypothetical protein
MTDQEQDREQPPAETLMRLWNPVIPPISPHRRLCKPLGDDVTMQPETPKGEALKLAEYMTERAALRLQKCKKLLQYMRHNRPKAFTIAELLELVKPLSKTAMQRYLRILKAQEFVESTGKRMPLYWVATGRKGEPE